LLSPDGGNTGDADVVSSLASLVMPAVPAARYGQDENGRAERFAPFTRG